MTYHIMHRQNRINANSSTLRYSHKLPTLLLDRLYQKEGGSELSNDTKNEIEHYLKESLSLMKRSVIYSNNINIIITKYLPITDIIFLNRK